MGEHMNLLIKFALIPLIILLTDNVEAPKSLFVEFNGRIDNDYTALVSRNDIHVYNFNLPTTSNTFLIQTNVASNEVSSPVVVYAFHSSYIETWSLPNKHPLFDEYLVHTTSRTACPEFKDGTVGNLTVRIQTFSLTPISYSLAVISVGSNILEIDQQVFALTSPSFPAQFVMDIPLNVALVDIRLSSPSQLCSLVRITDFSCPPDYTLRSSRAMKGYDLTMTGTADLSIRRSDFVGGRVMVLLIPLPALQCDTTVEYSADMQSDLFVKNVSLVISAGNNELWRPVLILTGVFLVPYLLFAIVIGCELIVAHFLPRLTKYFSIFSRVKRKAVQDCEEDHQSVSKPNRHDNADREAGITEIQLTDSTKVNQAPAEHAIDHLEENAYKREVMQGKASYHMEGIYHFNIINNGEMTVNDLYVKPIIRLQESAISYALLSILVGLFYMVPGIQVSYAIFKEMSATGAQDLCYINFKCDRQLHSIRAFNSIWSNSGYILFSILFLIIVAIKHISYVREVRAEGSPAAGIPQIFGIYYALCVSLFFEGVLSSIYHLCPSITSLQFDTTFIYVILALLSVRLYQHRHPDAKISPINVFFLIFLIVLFTTLSLLSQEYSPFPSKIILTIAIIVFTCIISYLIHTLFVPQLVFFYYKDWVKHRSTIRVVRLILWPENNKSRIFQILIIILADILTLLILWSPGFLSVVSSAALFYMAITLVLYLLYYWVVKIIKKDFVHRTLVFIVAFLSILVSTVCWGLAFYFWFTRLIPSNESASTARLENRECIFLGYYDHHDLWHIFSAFALFTLFLATLLIDENMSFVPREELTVF